MTSPDQHVSSLAKQARELFVVHVGRALPDFVKLAEAYGAVGIRAKTPDELDEKIKEMISTDKPVIFDCVVDKVENCYPMIPSGKPHNQMLLGPEDEKEVSDEGKTLV